MGWRLGIAEMVVVNWAFTGFKTIPYIHILLSTNWEVALLSNSVDQLAAKGGSLLKYHPHWPLHTQIEAGFPLTELIRSYHCGPIFWQYRGGIPIPRSMIFYWIWGLEWARIARNPQCGRAAQAVLDEHQKRDNGNQRTKFPRFYVAALTGIPNTANLCIGW